MKTTGNQARNKMMGQKWQKYFKRPLKGFQVMKHFKQSSFFVLWHLADM